MRHKKSGRKLNRNSSHRKALFKNLAIALIEKDIIKTTLPKAKELRKFIEPLITLGKNDNVANRRHKRYEKRNGGYTRIIKAGFRSGDKADMAYIELVDRKLEDSEASNEPELKEEESAA